MTKVESEVCASVVSVVKNFLGNTKVRNYAEIVDEMLQKIHNLGVNI